MQHYASDSSVQEIKFDKVPYWVQVHNIPVSFLTRKVAESLCEIVGDIQKSIGVVDEDGGTFFWVRVVIDINLPLCRGRVITMLKGDKAWINFKYEPLPSICYWCGCLDHDDRDCDHWVDSKGTLTTEQQQFALSLRAPPFKSARKDVIYIPGFHKKTNRRTQSKMINDDI